MSWMPERVSVITKPTAATMTPNTAEPLREQQTGQQHDQSHAQHRRRGHPSTLPTLVVGATGREPRAVPVQCPLDLLEARVARYRLGRARVDLDGRVAVVVDDGVATGSTARAACAVARELGAARVCHWSR